MPGTEREALVRSLTIAGWLFLGGAVGLIAFQIERVRSIGPSGSPFAGAWDQRLEVLSFLMLPPNLVVLVPAALLAAAAAWITGPDREIWLTTLLRIVIGIALAMLMIGVISIANILLRDNGVQSNSDAVFLRLGGMSLAAGVVVLCGSAHQAPRSALRKWDRQSNS